MPAKSKSQQRLFGMLHAYNKGELHGSKSLMKKMKSMSSHISDEDARHFAETPHKGLPEKKAGAINDLKNNLTDGADMLTTGMGKGLTYIPMFFPALGSGIYGLGEGLVTGQDPLETAASRAKATWQAGNSLGPKGWSIYDLQRKLDRHTDFIIDNYKRRNNIDETTGNPLDVAAMTALRTAGAAGEWIPGTGSKAQKAVVKAPGILSRIPGLAKLTQAKRYQKLKAFVDKAMVGTGRTAGVGAVAAQGAIPSIQPVIERQQQEFEAQLKKLTEEAEASGWKADALDRIENLKPGQEPDPVDLSSAPKAVPGQPGSALPGYLRAENNPETSVTLGKVLKLLRPAATAGAGIGALAGGTLGYALTDKRKPAWKKARNATLAAIAAGALGGLSGSAYKLYTATRG